MNQDWKWVVLGKTILIDSTPAFPATFLKEHNNSSITVTRNVLLNKNIEENI